MTKMQTIICVLGLLMIGCVQAQLKPNAARVVVTKTAPDKSLLVGEKDFGAPIIAVLGQEKARVNLLTRVKNFAATNDYDLAYIQDEKGNPPRVAVEDYSCKQLSEISDDMIEDACELEQPHACAEVGKRAQKSNSHVKMLEFFKRACKLSDKASCEWLDGYNQHKAKLKKACIAKDAESCFAAALLSDVEADYTLMVTFLKQGCSYGHSESCFYQNYAQEEKERIKEERSAQYQRYMANLQAETLRQQRIIATMSVLNSLPRTQNCVSRKQFDGSVATSCY